MVLGVGAAVVTLLLGAVVATGAAVVTGIEVVVAVEGLLLLPHAVVARAMPAIIATAVERRMWRIPFPSSVSDPTLSGYHPVGLWSD